MKRLNSWSEAEDATLAEIWKSSGSVANYVHLLPGRTRGAIEKRAQSIKLGARIVWTPEMDVRLRDIWENGSRIKTHLHEFPTHTITSINTRAYTLGLGKRLSRSRGVDPICWALIKRELAAADRACLEIAELLKLDKSNVYKHLGIRHRAKEIHVYDWKRLSASGKLVPVYRLGEGIDMPKPPPIPGVVKERKYQEARNIQRLLSGERVIGINPFAVAAGLVAVPSAATGRVYRQSMSIREDEEVMA